MSKRICSIEGCERPARSRGWCHMHYERWRRNGAPESLRNYRDPELAFQARTQRVGGCLLWMGATVRGYGSLWTGERTELAHRYAWERVNGPIPEAKVVDHRYHCDPRCCEVSHLRLATQGENKSHRAGANPGRREPLPRNVSPHGRGYRVQVKRDSVGHYLGTYASIEDASSIAERARTELFGDFAGRS